MRRVAACGAPWRREGVVKRPRGPAKATDRVIVSRWESAWVAWWWKRWKGISVPVWWRMSDRERPAVWNLTPEEYGEMKRPTVPGAGEKDRGVDIPAGKVLMRHERLGDLLSKHAWDDGGTKGQRSVMLFIALSSVRCLVKVECPPLKLSTVGRSIDEALTAMDAILGADDVPWEADIPHQSNGFKKKK